MGRKLAVEKHPHRHIIEQMLAERTPITQISKQFGISRDAIARYRDSFEGSFKSVVADRV